MSISSATGSGKGKSKESKSSYAANTLANMAKEFARETKGTRAGLVNIFEDVLQTGGSTSLNPIIASAVEQSQKATSDTLKQTEESLAASNLSGTPFAENVLAKTRLSGEQATNQIAPGIAQKILQMIPNYVIGQSQTATSGLAGAVPGTTTTRTKGETHGISQAESFSWPGGGNK